MICSSGYRCSHFLTWHALCGKHAWMLCLCSDNTRAHECILTFSHIFPTVHLPEPFCEVRGWTMPLWGGIFSHGTQVIQDLYMLSYLKLSLLCNNAFTCRADSQWRLYALWSIIAAARKVSLLEEASRLDACFHSSNSSFTIWTSCRIVLGSHSKHCFHSLFSFFHHMKLLPNCSRQPH